MYRDGLWPASMTDKKKNIIIIQARMNSSRLPGKVMKNLSGKPMLSHVVLRSRASQKAGSVCVATSKEGSDDRIAALCAREGVPCHRGSLTDVLARYADAARDAGAATVIRITADCPLVDPHVVDSCIAAYEASGADYVSNVVPGPRTFPRGLDVEVFSLAALKKAEREASAPYDREHVTPYIWRNDAGAFTIGPAVTASKEYARPYRLCVDYPEDLSLVQKVYELFFVPGELLSVPETLAFLDAHPEWAALNAHCEEKSVQAS